MSEVELCEGCYIYTAKEGMWDKRYCVDCHFDRLHERAGKVVRYGDGYVVVDYGCGCVKRALTETYR